MIFCIVVSGFRSSYSAKKLCSRRNILRLEKIKLNIAFESSTKQDILSFISSKKETYI